MTATGKVIGTVTAVVGEAKATAADGTVRILQVGDAVHGDEVISTSAAGSINVALESGKTLDCGGDVSLTLHESILGVATAASPSSDAPASDVDAIQRAIAAGQDPSQVAAATAAGGAPAAGGFDDGGAHEPVILEQSNTASAVTSGFTTEGDTITFAVPQVQSEPGVVVASVSAPLASSAESALSSIPAITVVENTSQPQVSISADQPVVPMSIVEPAQSAPVVTVETALDPVVQNNEAPQIVATSPVVVADAGTDNGAAEEVQPPVVFTPPSSEPVNEDASSPADTPVIVATDTPGDDEVADSPQPPVVVTQPEDETVVVNEPEGDDVVTVVDEPSGDVSDPAPEVTGVLTSSISANTNQDEQIALLTLHNGENTFQTLVFFHQEGQQKPTAAPLGFAIDHDAESTINLEYIGAFAGNSDASTGHTAQKIAVKDFTLGEGDVTTVLAQESDGVNIGYVGKATQLVGTTHLQDGSHDAWSFSSDASAEHNRIDYDANAQSQDGGAGFDILNVSGDLDLTLLSDEKLNSFEVISLKGAGQQVLTLSVDDVLKVTDNTVDNVLHILGGKEQVQGEIVQDTLNLVGGGWQVTDSAYFGWVQVKNAGATLLVDADIQIKGLDV